MTHLQIKGWRQHQHYSDRCPPWIKVHSEILDSVKWRSLTDASKAQLLAIWVLASRLHEDAETDAAVPSDAAYLAALTGCKITSRSLQTLVSKGFLVPCEHDASGVLTKCSPETETETETETEAQSCAAGAARNGTRDFERFWSHYPKRRGRRDALKAWKQTAKERPPIDEIVATVDAFAVSDKWLEDNGQWIPYPATWLRRGGWDDELR